VAVHGYQADLHIHTLLSPCGEIEMIPTLIVAAAVQAKLDIIAIADHNSCENAASVIEAAAGSGIRVLPGMEVQSLEGVHLLCLFDTIEQAETLQQAVYATLPGLPAQSNEAEKKAASEVEKEFAGQIIVDANDEFAGYCRQLLSLPTSLDIDEIWERTDSIGGILIPSHIDRKSTGLCDVLGMVPDTPELTAVEVSRNIDPAQALERYPSIGNRSIICNSDAHWLSAIGERRTTFFLEHRNIAELKMACRGADGRRVERA
jgi:PHP family Zn ribbon phosphoesterase